MPASGGCSSRPSCWCVWVLLVNATLQYTHTCAHKGTDIWVTAALSQLTATAPGRQQVRGQGAYLILRELHSWEPEPDVRVACEKLIQVCAGLEGGWVFTVHQPAAHLHPCWQVLIGDEPEHGMENLLEVQVPGDVEQQLDSREQEPPPP